MVIKLGRQYPQDRPLKLVRLHRLLRQPQLKMCQDPPFYTYNYCHQDKVHMYPESTVHLRQRQLQPYKVYLD